jgi:hypothetical protein
MTLGSSAMHLPPYHVNYHGPFDQFWKSYGHRDRRILFIFGAGYDPRAIPALATVRRLLGEVATLDTFCARFTNRSDDNFADNSRRSDICLAFLRQLTREMTAKELYHHEVEVDMFDDGLNVIGDQQIQTEFDDTVGRRLDTYTDVIVDVSAFPRVLLFTLLRHIWKRRPDGNLFALLTEAPIEVRIAERGHGTPRYLGDPPNRDTRILWVPVLGAAIERFRTLYEFLKPFDVVPIVPFPAKNPRVGDNIIIDAWHGPFDRWKVPLTNVMYASADNPFDVFRKLVDVVESLKVFRDENAGPYYDQDLSVIVSALSGRSLSLGVLLAALHEGLTLCHSQPTSYELEEKTFLDLLALCSRDELVPTVYWLAGDLYRSAG